MAKQDSPLVLGAKPTNKPLTQYVILAIVAMTVSPLYSMVDSVFIGCGMGASVISNLALTFPLMNLTVTFGSLVGVGASTLVIVKLGQKDYEGVNEISGNALILNVALGVAFTIVFLSLLDPVPCFFSASENTISYTCGYIRIILYDNAVTRVYLELNAVLHFSRFPKAVMYVTLAPVVINCALNPLFIFGFGWGTKESAQATVISQMISPAGQLIHFSGPRQLLHSEKGIYGLRSEIVKGILSIGLFPFLVNLCSCLIVILTNRGLKEYGGDMAIGAYGIMDHIVFLFVMITMGFNQGMQPIASYNYGAWPYSRTTGVARPTMHWAAGVVTLGFLLCQLVSPRAVCMFTGDGELISAASYGLCIVFTIFPTVGFQMMTTNFFFSIGMSKKVTFLSLTRQALFLTPCLILLPPLFGTLGIWISMPIADTMATIVTAIVLVKQLKQFKYGT